MNPTFCKTATLGFNIQKIELIVFFLKIIRYIIPGNISGTVLWLGQCFTRGQCCLAVLWSSAVRQCCGAVQWDSAVETGLFGVRIYWDSRCKLITL